MAAVNTMTTLNGLFKDIYADQIEKATPDEVVFLEDIKFASGEKELGNNYKQPVLLAYEHGFTYGGSASGVLTLNAAIAGQMKEASVAGTQMYLRSQIDYETAARASKAGAKSFKQAFSVVVENMWTSSKKRAELDLIYGRSGLGVISAINHTTGVITLTTADFAAGHWVGMENAVLNAYASVNNTATKHELDLTITAVDTGARTITVTATDNTDVAAGDILCFKGQRATAGAWAVANGIHAILANTGTMFSIDAATYSLWKANTYAVGSVPLSFGAIQRGIAQAVGKGVAGTLNLYINPGAWADLVTDEAALRRHVKGGSEAAYRAGAEGIEFFSQNGKIVIKPTPFVKEGYAYAITPSQWMRIGATDLTFRLPDRGDEFFLHLADQTGYELRCMLNHAPFCKSPAKCILFTGIVNSTS